MAAGDQLISGTGAVFLSSTGHVLIKDSSNDCPECCEGTVTCNKLCSYCPTLDHGGTYASDTYDISITTMDGSSCCFVIEHESDPTRWRCEQYWNGHADDDMTETIEITRDSSVNNCYWAGSGHSVGRKYHDFSYTLCDCSSLTEGVFAVGSPSWYFWISSGPTANLIVTFPDQGNAGSERHIGCLFYGSATITDCCDDMTISNTTTCDSKVALNTLPSFIETAIKGDYGTLNTHLWLMATGGTATIAPERT